MACVDVGERSAPHRLRVFMLSCKQQDVISAILGGVAGRRSREERDASLFAMTGHVCFTTRRLSASVRFDVREVFQIDSYYGDSQK